LLDLSDYPKTINEKAKKQTCCKEEIAEYHELVGKVE